jgi:simple sugar transport system permease protein
MIASLLASAVRLGTPLLFAALGGVMAERSGVATIALEGMMLIGAYASVATAAATQSAVLGLAAGVAAGAAIGLLHALLTQTARVPAILSGLGINLGALGATTYGLRGSGDAGLQADVGLPVEGLALVVALCTGLAWWFLGRTAAGLRLIAVGENPEAARGAGIEVERVRFGALAGAGALAGLGGVALALSGLSTFTENMTAGRGYIALAAVIFGRWTPLGAAGAAALFALGDAGQIALQTAGLARVLPPDLLSLAPYAITLVALGMARGRGGAPAALSE